MVWECFSNYHMDSFAEKVHYIVPTRRALCSLGNLYIIEILICVKNSNGPLIIPQAP